MTLPQRLRDRPAPPRQHLLGERAGRKTVRRPHADRQGDDDDAAARPAPRRARSTRSPARAACRGWPSSSTARSIWSRGPKPRRSPRAGSCRPRSRSSPTRRSATSASTVFGGKTGYLVNTRDLCAHTPVTKIAYTGQNGKTHSRIGQGQGRLRQEEGARQAPPPLSTALRRLRPQRYAAVRKPPPRLGKCGGDDSGKPEVRVRPAIAAMVAVLIGCGVLGVVGLGVEDKLDPLSLTIDGTGSARGEELAKEHFGDATQFAVLLTGPQEEIERQGPPLVRALRHTPEGDGHLALGPGHGRRAAARRRQGADHRRLPRPAGDGDARDGPRPRTSSSRKRSSRR